MKFSKILVPLDGSLLAEAALWKAVEIADGGTISLLRAAEAPTLPGVDSPKAQVAAVRKAQEYLRRVIKRLNSKGMSNVEGNVWCGPPPVAIVEAAQRQKIDLIVMSTHGRSGLGRLVLGSVTESVLRGSTVPILIIRPDGAPVDAPVGGVGPAGPSFRV